MDEGSSSLSPDWGAGVHRGAAARFGSPTPSCLDWVQRAVSPDQTSPQHGLRECRPQSPMRSQATIPQPRAAPLDLAIRLSQSESCAKTLQQAELTLLATATALQT